MRADDSWPLLRMAFGPLYDLEEHFIFLFVHFNCQVGVETYNYIR